MNNKLKKANTFEWIQITTKNGVTYQRRQRKKIKTTIHTPLENKQERLSEWTNKDSLASLKDKLAVAVKYNSNYYDTKGDLIYVPDRYKDIAEEIHHSKNNDSTFTNYITGNKTDIEKQKKNRLIGTIKLKDKIFQQELKKKQDFFDQTENSSDTARRNIYNFLQVIHKERSSINDMLYALKYARGKIDDSIDPTIEITYGGKKQERTLDEIIAQLEGSQKIKTMNTGIESLKLLNLNDYDADDFTKNSFTMNQVLFNQLVEKTNKKFQGLSRKTE